MALTAELCGTFPIMDETRSVKISIMLTPSTATRLDTYAQQHRWSRSAAAEVLIENGLTEARQEEGRSWG